MQLRVIVIDDDAACRELMELFLRDRGYEVICLPDPTACPLFADADCSCEQEAVCGDFLLTDNRMPGMTGLQFVARQVEGGCKGIVANKAVLSGSWNDTELAEARRLGCRIFGKPFDLDAIALWLDTQAKAIPPHRKLVDFSLPGVAGAG